MPTIPNGPLGPERSGAAWPSAFGTWSGSCADPRQIRGVAVTGMGMDGLPVAKRRPWLYPFISWHCPRTEPQYRWWLEHVGAERQFALGGNQVWVFNTALRLLWMREHEPAILDRAEKWLLIEDFVNFMLCGRMATDYSMASTTLLFDQRRRRWSDELLAALGHRPPACSATRCPAARCWAESMPARPKRRVCPPARPWSWAATTTAAARFLRGRFRPGVLLDVTGTWEMVVARWPSRC